MITLVFYKESERMKKEIRTIKRTFLLLCFTLFLGQNIGAQNSSNEYENSTDDEYVSDSEAEEFKGLKDEKKKKVDLSRLRIGGDFGLGFGGQNVFAAEVSPTVGYQVLKDRLEPGIGLVYQHESRANFYNVNNYGAQAYIRGYIWDGLFAQVDGFLVRYNYNSKVQNTKTSFTYGNGFGGIGYAFNHKDAPFYFSISVKTNLVINKYYPRRLIIPKVGFQFRL